MNEINLLQTIIIALNEQASAEKAQHHFRFFKTGLGEYGEGDKFIGVNVPFQRKIAKKYFRDINLSELEQFLRNEIHEYRSIALFMLCYKFEKANEPGRSLIADFYLNNISFVNNWDLVMLLPLIFWAVTCLTKTETYFTNLFIPTTFGNNELPSFQRFILFVAVSLTILSKFLKYCSIIPTI